MFERHNGDDFREKGTPYRRAWIALQDCAVPPSLEVFDYELELRRRQTPSVTPELLGRRLSESYHRVSFSHEDY